MDILEDFYSVFDCEIDQLVLTKKNIYGEIAEAIEVLSGCNGKVVLCGMGKPGHIGQKIAATMSSCGIPAFFLHPAEGVHGDLGCIMPNDVIIIISNSGETEEVQKILPAVKRIGVPIIAITSNENSALARQADYRILHPVLKEAGNLELAPTSSTTAELLIGDALAIVVSKRRNFSKKQFAMYHPSGTLGKRLVTRVEDLMHGKEEKPLVLRGSNIQDAVMVLCRLGLGAVMIVDEKTKLLGLITDGDLKRFLEKKIDVYNETVEHVMTKNPITVSPEALAIEALQLMECREKQLSVLPVVDNDGNVLGLLRLHDVLGYGIV